MESLATSEIPNGALSFNTPHDHILIKKKFILLYHRYGELLLKFTIKSFHSLYVQELTDHQIIIQADCFHKTFTTVFCQCNTDSHRGNLNKIHQHQCNDLLNLLFLYSSHMMVYNSIPYSAPNSD